MNLPPELLTPAGEAAFKERTVKEAELLIMHCQINDAVRAAVPVAAASLIADAARFERDPAAFIRKRVQIIEQLALRFSKDKP